MYKYNGVLPTLMDLDNAVAMNNVALVNAILKSHIPDVMNHEMMATPIINAIKMSNCKILRMFMDYRGSKDAPYINFNSLSRFIHNVGKYCKSVPILHMLMSWKSPDGNVLKIYSRNSSYIDLVRDISAYSNYKNTEIAVQLIDYLLNNHLDRLDNLSISFHAAICDIDSFYMRNYLLHWRGPKNEFIDIRHDYFIDSAIYNCNDTLFDTLLCWRGPNGEYIDMTNFHRLHNRGCAVNFIAYTIRHGTIYMVKSLLEWRGPNGEFFNIDRTKISILLQLGKIDDPEKRKTLVAIIIRWKGPNGEKVRITHDDLESLFSHDFKYSPRILDVLKSLSYYITHISYFLNDKGITTQVYATHLYSLINEILNNVNLHDDVKWNVLDYTISNNDRKLYIMKDPSRSFIDNVIIFMKTFHRTNYDLLN